MKKLSVCIDNNIEFLSHPKEDEKHNLIKHLVEVANSTQELLSQTDFDISLAGYYAGLLHDIGKLNPFYQELFLAKKKDINKKREELMLKYTNFHSPFSAWAGLNFYDKKKIGGLDYNRWFKIVSVIYGHHSSLRKLLPFKEIDLDKEKYITSKRGLILNLNLFYQQIRGNIRTEEFLNLNWERCLLRVSNPISFQNEVKLSANRINTDNITPIKEFLEINALYSALLQADKGSFKEWKTPVFDISLNTSTLIKSGSNLEDLRGRFQKQALENHDPLLDINILHAPTGIGKTKVFLDILDRYTQNRKFERVFYFSPLLALTEDFEKKIARTIENTDDVLIYNHLFSGTLLEKEEDLQKRNEDKKSRREEWLFEYESFNEKFIITTTQRLLITLFSNKSANKLKLLSLKNSILIIDEIQTIPKFIIPHLIGFLQQLSKYMKSKILLVSATIPFELSSLPEIKISDSILSSYLEKTQKNICFTENLTLPELSDKKKRVLIMANTRKKTANIFNRINSQPQEEKSYDTQKVFYISSGIRKKDRIKIINELTTSREEQEENQNPIGCIIVSTQVIEAGVDISFSHIFREAAPLDSIIQTMGRLNREGEFNTHDSQLTIFQEDNNHRPYTELEYNVSLPILKTVKTSKDLYAELPEYYKTVSTKNAKNKQLSDKLDFYISDMNFEEVWKFVNSHALPDDDRDNVFIPSTIEEWHQIKDAFLKTDTESQRKSLSKIFKKFVPLTASLPKSINIYKIKDDFDEDLFDESILMPKLEFFQNPEKLRQIYDKDLGLDILLCNDQLLLHQ